MRKIEVPDADTMAEWFDKRPSNDFSEESPYLNYCHGIVDTITYANTILQTLQEHKRPFLSRDEISSGSLDFYNNTEPTPTDGQIAAWKVGARWTRDRYEEMLSQADAVKEDWQPYWP